jgi:simple sugar transport system permease protein
MRRTRWAALDAKQLRALIVVAIVVVLIAYFYARNGVKTTSVLQSTVPRATPLALAALCGLVGERTGVINIGIEGQMLFAAFASFYAAVGSGSLIVGTLVGVATASTLGLFLALCAVTWRVDQIIAGTVINILAAGATSFFYAQGRSLDHKLPTWEIPGLHSIPLAGKVLFTNTPITFLSFIVVAALHIGLFKTRWGLRTRAVGEHPSAADTVGISVERLRYLNVMAAGGLAGLAGAAISLNTSFERGMTAQRGFTALAVLIFGRWRPWLAFAAALFFGFLDALANQLQFDKVIDVSPQFINMVPYVLTIAVLAILGGRVRPPAAAGRPYTKE